MKTKSSLRGLTALFCGLILIIGGVVYFGFINPVQLEKHTVEITMDEAIQIALEDAGQVDNKNVVFQVQSRERERGVWIYEFQFDDSINQYEYNINAQTGEIITQNVKALD